MKKYNLVDNKIVIDQTLPHNFLAEKTVLSCLFLNSKSIEITIQTLKVDAFYFKNHQEIYKALVFMYKRQMSIDFVTFLAFLQDNGLIEKVGGIQVIRDLTSRVPNLAFLRDYLSVVQEKFIRRSLIKLGYEIINASYITNISIETVLDTFETKIFQINQQLQKKEVFSSAEVVKTVFFELKKKSLNPSLLGVSSGFYDLDTLIQGFQKSDFIIVAGRPSMGKTALSLNFALNVVKFSKLPILFFSLEMSKEQIMYRLLSMESSINQVRLKTGKLDSNDWIKLNKVMKVISKLPFFIDDTSNLSVDRIRSKLKTLMFQQKQIGLVIIDYLQLMQDSNFKTENRVQELSKITRALKMMAREFNIPIMALSQLSRNIETRVDKKPMLSDLRESGSIEQDADLILMLYKTTSDKFTTPEANFLELLVAKHRNGPTGSIQLKFVEKQTKFVNFLPQ